MVAKYRLNVDLIKSLIILWKLLDKKIKALFLRRRVVLNFLIKSFSIRKYSKKFEKFAIKNQRPCLRHRLLLKFFIKSSSNKEKNL